MAKESIIVGLDIGTYLTKVLVAKRMREDRPPVIIALGTAYTEGVRKGVIIDIQDTTKTIVNALEKVSKVVDEDIVGVYVNIGGSQVTCRESHGKVAVSKFDGDVTEEDVERVISNANEPSTSPNRKVIELIKKDFILDEEAGIKNPVGMNGIRLELEAMLIETSLPYLKNLEKCIHNAGIGIEKQTFSILAASKSILVKKQLDLGVAIVDIGAGTTSIAVFEEGKLMHAVVIPIGAAHITNDMAIGMRTSVEVAERVKLHFTSILDHNIEKGEKREVNLAKIKDGEIGVFSESFLSNIIEARLEEIFALVNKEFKKINRVGMLPAGVVITGGGARTPGITQIAKKELKLPIQIGYPHGVEGTGEKIDDPIYATAVGLVVEGFEELELHEFEGENKFGGVGRKVGGVFGKIGGLIKSLTPG